MKIGDRVKVIDTGAIMDMFYLLGETGTVVNAEEGDERVEFDKGEVWYVVPEHFEVINTVNEVEVPNTIGGIGPAGKSPRDYLRERISATQHNIKIFNLGGEE